MVAIASAEVAASRVVGLAEQEVLSGSTFAIHREIYPDANFVFAFLRTVGSASITLVSSQAE